MIDLLATLQRLPASSCDYDEWLKIGMALKEEGYSVTDWELWSALDTTGRFHSGECERKWNGFRRDSGNKVTGGTVVNICFQHGVEPVRVDGSAERDFAPHNDKGATQTQLPAQQSRSSPPTRELRLPEQKTLDQLNLSPSDWDSTQELITFLDTVFQSDDIVGYLTSCHHKRENPEKIELESGISSRTAGELIDNLREAREAGSDNPIREVFGPLRYDGEKDNDKGGAWIRVNPLDGHGIKDENVTAFRHVLVESDEMTLPEQERFLRGSQLPITALTYSAGKSIHALVRVDAESYPQYQERVRFLFDYCKEQGFIIDEANKNPSRFSRFPGFTRGGKPQHLLGTRLGRKSWADWYQWVTMPPSSSDLPEIESLADTWESPPELAPELIEGFLRQGHKMIISAPSKAGKSFLVDQLMIAVAEGGKWLGRQCRQGRALYINTEIDRASCINRYHRIYHALGIRNPHVDNVHLLNLRGKAASIQELTPKIIDAARGGNYSLICFDPVYKLLGNADENAAGDMGRFVNELDRIATELGASVVFVHHFAKGYAGAKSSIDRFSGSGVLARDPDSIVTLTQLHRDDAVNEWLDDYAKRQAAQKILDQYDPTWRERVSGEEIVGGKVAAEGKPTGEQLYHWVDATMPELGVELMNELTDQLLRLEYADAWRVEATLREFATPKPINVVYCYPIHVVDEAGALDQCEFENGQAQARAAASQRLKEQEQRAAEKQAAKRAQELDELSTLFDMAQHDGGAKIRDLLDAAHSVGNNTSKSTLHRWIDNSTEFIREKGVVYRRDEDGNPIKPDADPDQATQE